jgi:hypothetical protein
MNPEATVTEFQIGGRLIPRKLVTENAAAVTAAFRLINSYGALISGITGSFVKPSGQPANSVNPVWRDSIISATLLMSVM